MVGAINPNETQTLDDQIESAQNVKFGLAPGEPMPKEDGGGGSSEQVHKISTPVMIGVSVGIVVFLCLCAVLFFFIGRNKSLKEVVQRRDGDAMMKPVGAGGNSELGYMVQQRESTSAPQTPRSLQGGYPQDFGSPLPPYASPRMGASGVQYARYVLSVRIRSMRLILMTG